MMLLLVSVVFVMRCFRCLYNVFGILGVVMCLWFVVCACCLLFVVNRLLCVACCV